MAGLHLVRGYKNRMKLAPIALFVFNRPSHTRSTLQALEANALADLSELHIFADGPRMNSDTEQLSQISAVDEIICQDWKFKKIYIHRKKHNWGLADSIIDGVTRVVTESGKVIVLEDDIVTSQGFLKYMNDALEFYQSNENVMHVSAYMFPVEGELPSTFFYNTGSCWGWGTWQRAWRHFEADSDRLIASIEKQGRWDEFNIESTYSFEKQLRDNAAGSLRTWAVKWYASFFLRGGHALHPYPSLVNNIGHDGAGENCGSSRIYDWDRLATNINIQEISIEESISARAKMREFNIKLTASFSNKRAIEKKRWLKRLRKKIKLKLKDILNRGDSM